VEGYGVEEFGPKRGYAPRSINPKRPMIRSLREEAAL
jgi:hypothetical protein